MAAPRRLVSSAFRSSSPSLRDHTLRLMTTSPAPPSHADHQHEYSKPSDFIGSWKSSKNPKSAEKRLGRLRIEYAKQVRELRKEYIHEMELQRLEKLRKDEANREAISRAKEERKAAKAAMAEAKAAERKVFEEEFRQTLLKERADKLEYWRLKQKEWEAKKQEKKELIRRQSSLWIDEKDQEKVYLEAIVNGHSLS
ncbi:hypothetical protein Scep_008390 [Stephania cephalantha]|uniref:Uncharacterized protein n=1 Tax=Stephania cephalantha TaxID=152367 RepID=A0AAP0PM13_9MAGN